MNYNKYMNQLEKGEENFSANIKVE